MDLVHAVCAGLDVHKETVVACVRRVVNGTVRHEVRTVRTETGQLLARTDRRTDEQVPPVAMASTGVYWKPIRNRFEGVFELHLCNAEYMKAVPGRKTAVKDAQWLAQLLAHGLLKPSVVGASGRWWRWGHRLLAVIKFGETYRELGPTTWTGRPTASGGRPDWSSGWRSWA